MSGKYTWKIVLTAAVLVWVVLNLIPLTDTPFDEYFSKTAQVSPDKRADFDALVARAKQQVSDGTSKTFFVALKQISSDESIDLATLYFPNVGLESTLKNVKKRNGILLNHLLKESRGALQPGLDLRGGVSFILEVGQKAETDTRQREEDLAKAIEIIGDRIDERGVAEPIIRPVGDNRIEVQIASLNTKDDPEVVNDLKKPARLDFRLVHLTETPDPANPGYAPPGYEAMTLEDERGGQTYTEELFVKRVPEMTGEMVDVASVYTNEYGRAQIQLKLTDDGAERFGQVTGDLYEAARGPEGRLAIVLDGKLASAPRVLGRIDGGTATITGSFTDREALELANILNNPLDVELSVVSMSEVGPSLAQDSIISGRNAFIVGTVLTAVFMIVFYTIGGVFAVVGMVLNVVIILGVMASNMVGATLSMPGIAGIVLTLGMSVDANILIFERMREESATGKNLRASLEAGFEKAFSAIFDANITTLFTAIIMIVLGSGAVKGFGVTLTIGIFSTMFTALIVTRLLMEVIVYSGGLKKITFLHFPLPSTIDYMKYAKPAFLTSWTIVLLGVVVVAVKGSSIYGIDFTGGDEVTLNFSAGHRLDPKDIYQAGTELGLRQSDILPVYQTPIGSDTEQLKIQCPFDNGRPLAEKLVKMYPDSQLSLDSETSIGGSVSKQLQWNAFLAIGASLVVILIYVAFRFEIGYGVGAVVATVHDVFMTIGIFVLFDRQFNAAMVGAILLIVGYSINDTIVVFDRIREELTLNPGSKLRDVINLSLNRTLVRTVNTGGTTLLTALALVFIAGGVVNDIAFTLVIGIITGTFSSIFIASPIFFWWHKGDRKHVEESHDLAPKYEWSASSRAAE